MIIYILAGGSNSTAPGQTLECDPKNITFVPDYSAVIRDDCTYLEISAQTYLLAYKSTLISRNKFAYLFFKTFCYFFNLGIVKMALKKIIFVLVMKYLSIK